MESLARRGKRLLGLTAPGQELLPVAERIPLDVQNIKRLGTQCAQQDTEHLAIATTKARYAQPPVVGAGERSLAHAALAGEEEMAGAGSATDRGGRPASPAP
ncbi:hypothetical protein AB6N21_003021 [Thiohalocapsa marina]|nr:hypothetical protein [Thiohalocapsa marina]